MKQGIARNSLSGLGLSLLLTSAGGCAFGDRLVHLEYTGNPSNPVQEIRKNEGLSIGKFESSIQLDDKGRAIVGCVRNGYGWKTAKVLSTNSPAEWLRDAFSLELRKRGYEVYSEEQGDKKTSKLEGEITYLYADILMNYHANVSFVMSIKKNEKVIYTDAFNGNAEPLAWFGTPAEYENALNESLERALSVAIPRLVSKLEAISK